MVPFSSAAVGNFHSALDIMVEVAVVLLPTRFEMDGKAAGVVTDAADDCDETFPAAS